MHNILNLFYFGATLYMFRTVFSSIIRGLRMYIQHQVHVMQVLWLLASKHAGIVHLVGFTIEIYYDARSYKRQTPCFSYLKACMYSTHINIILSFITLCILYLHIHVELIYSYTKHFGRP
jgi:hypothetical protein